VPTRRSKKPTIDLEEVRPRYFVMHNPAVRPLIKSEGTFEGNRFAQTGWRRDGMLARLRMNGFSVLTLEDRLERLPRLPAAPPIGAACPRALTANERYSYFDPATLDWTPIEPIAATRPDDQAGQSEQAVMLRTGWLIRRRRGRGPAGYYRAFRESSGSAGLTPLAADAALLQGYAQATQHNPPPLALAQTPKGEPLLPDLLLPAPHQDIRQRIARRDGAGWQVDAHGWPLARGLCASLGLRLARTPE
jgi:hypothetical protein